MPTTHARPCRRSSRTWSARCSRARWTNGGLWVLTELSEDGPLRFSRLLERVGRISARSRSPATLRQLERDGLVTRTMVAQVPIRVDYAATPLGRGLVEQVHPLWLWAIEHLSAFTAARAAYDAGNRLA